MNFDAELMDIFEKFDTPLSSGLLASLEEFANFVYSEGYNDGMYDQRQEGDSR